MDNRYEAHMSLGIKILFVTYIYISLIKKKDIANGNGLRKLILQKSLTKS